MKKLQNIIFFTFFELAIIEFKKKQCTLLNNKKV